MDYSVMTEAECVAQAQNGDSRAYDELFVRGRSRVLRYCQRLLHDARDAEDATQETLLKGWRVIGTFRGDGGFQAWIMSIALRTCLNIMRQREWKQNQRNPSVDDPQFREESSDEKLEDRIVERLYVERLCCLFRDRIKERRDLDIFLMMDYLGMNSTEAGKVLGMNANTIRDRRKRIIKPLLDEFRTQLEMEE